VLGVSVTNQFVTAEFRLVRPQQGDQVVEGQALVLEGASPTLSFAKVRYLANNVELAVASTVPYTNRYVVPAIAVIGSNQITFRAEALSAADVKLAEASATVTVFRANEDSDGTA
jgi:hypothetical protein